MLALLYLSMTEGSRTIHDEEWSDKKCLEIALKDNFPSSVFDLNVQKKIINRFLNFYLGGRPSRGLSVYDLVYATISIMPLDNETEDFIWRKVHYHEKGTLFFLTPEDKFNADVRTMMAKRSEKNNNDRSEVLHEDPELKSRSETESDIKGETEKENDDFLTEPPVLNGDYARSNCFDIDCSSSKNFDFYVATENNLSESFNASSFEIEQIRTNEENLNESDFDTKSVDCNQEIDNFEDCTSFASSNANINIPKLPNNLAWYRRNKAASSQAVKYRTFEPSDNTDFVIACNTLLKHWDNYANARIFLKYFFGMIALTLMRATTKSYKHLVNTFSSEKYISMLPKTALVSFKYVMPQKLCLKMSYRTFCRRGIDIRIMFAKLVINSVFHLSGQKRFNPFLMTVLAHTSQYGMGLLSLVDNVRRHYDGDLDDVIEVTYNQKTSGSWNRMVSFAEEHLCEARPTLTVWWARLIEPNLFTHLSCPQNYPLAVILTTFIESLTENPNVWRSKWLSATNDEKANDLEQYKKIGCELYEKLIKEQRNVELEFACIISSLKEISLMTGHGY